MKNKKQSQDSRELAIQIIFETRYNSGYINKQLQEVKELSRSDMGFLTNIVYGVMKDYDYLLAVLEQQNVELSKNKRIIRVILAVALYQFLMLDKIPTYAIIDSAVRIARKKTNDFSATFVNATLRQVLQDKENLKLDVESKEKPEQLALLYSMPLWLTRLVIAQYGIEKTENYYQWSRLANRQFARVNSLKATQEEILAIDGFVKAELPNAVEYLEGNIAATEAYQNGLLTIQNLSSQKVGQMLDPQPEEKILDMCAAPGGKTTHLAELAKDKADITALDIYPFRAKQIEENAKRLGLTSIQAFAKDALVVENLTYYDKILLDAPCSGLGVLRQKPEIKYQLTPEMLDELVILQKNLLEAAWKQLKVGGILVYSTCTINKKENEKQVATFLQKTEQAELLTEEHIFDEMQNGYAGFYLAKLKKIGE